MIRPRRILAAACVLALATARAWAGFHVQMPGIDAKAGASVGLSCMLDQLPFAGFAPIRITVRNDAPDARRWDFTFQSTAGYAGGGITSQTAVEVPAQSEKTVEFLVPIDPTLTDYSYPNLRITCNGPGGPGSYTWSPGSLPGMGGHRTPTLAVSSDLATPIWSLLQGQAQKESRCLAGSPFTAAEMPANPLAWIGWDMVWLSDTQWSAAEGAQRRALLDWVKLGGRLVVVSKGAQLPSLPELPAAAATDVGGGSIDRLALPGTSVQQLQAKIWEACGASPSGLREMAESYMGRWSLGDAVPAIKVHTGPILLFVTLFAILIGPVNLIILARRQRHMHLFWTTPLLALLASAVLGVVIILQDGFGGSGARSAFVYLDPEGHQACIWQEQISRTGVLLDRSFTRATPYYLADLPLATIDVMNKSVTAELQGERWSGAWFASRQVQAQHLAAVQPTRSRVRVDRTNPARPAAVSELPVPLSELHYVDPTGGLWRAQAVAPGTTQPLQPASAEEHRAACRRFWDAAGPIVRHRLPDPNQPKPGWFFAEAAQSSEHVIDTLPSIRWKQTTIRYFGPAAAEDRP